MSANKRKVLEKYPNAHCYMSQLSGMYFVKSSHRRNRKILGYQTTANGAWKDATFQL